METLPDVIDPTDPEAIAEAITPYFSGDTNKNKYLSFRASGFTFNEAIKLARVSYRTVMRWRADDPDFKHLDTNGISELRDNVGSNYLRMEFTRNYRLVLERDRLILDKAVAQEEMTKEEAAYLRSMRSQYTPVALAQLEEAMGEDTKEQFDLRSLVMRMTKNGQTAELSVRSVEE